MARKYNYRWTLRRHIAERYDGNIIVWDCLQGKYIVTWGGYGLQVKNETNSWLVTLVPTGYKCDRDNLPLYIHRVLRRLGETFGSNEALKEWIYETLKSV